MVKKASNILILLVATWCTAIMIAPLLAASEGIAGSFSLLLYKLFGVICHQFDSRTFHIDGHPFGVCIRCTAIYFGFLIGIITHRFSHQIVDSKFNNRIIFFMTLIPIFIDGILSFANFYEPTTSSRLITGGIFGFGLSTFLYSSLLEMISFLFNINKKEYEYTL